MRSFIGPDFPSARPSAGLGNADLDLEAAERSGIAVPVAPTLSHLRRTRMPGCSGRRCHAASRSAGIDPVRSDSAWSGSVGNYRRSLFRPSRPAVEPLADTARLTGHAGRIWCRIIKARSHQAVPRGDNGNLLPCAEMPSHRSVQQWCRCRGRRPAPIRVVVTGLCGKLGGCKSEFSCIYDSRVGREIRSIGASVPRSGPRP